MHKSVSVTSFHSAGSIEKNSSKTNLGPNVSASSLQEIIPACYVNEPPKEFVTEELQISSKTIEIDLSFSRQELHERLQHLVMNSMKNFNGDLDVKLRNN